MNKYEKAWKNITTPTDKDDDYAQIDFRKEIDIIDELVERARPMKPFDITIDKVFELEIGYCPSCNGIVQDEFCNHCGQTLDWSE